MKSDDLVAIIDFLYYGEANIYQDNLDVFLAKADELHLKGLSDNYIKEQNNESRTPDQHRSKKEASKTTSEKVGKTQPMKVPQNNEHMLSGLEPTSVQNNATNSVIQINLPNLLCASASFWFIRTTKNFGLEFFLEIAQQ